MPVPLAEPGSHGPGLTLDVARVATHPASPLSPFGAARSVQPRPGQRLALLRPPALADALPSPAEQAAAFIAAQLMPFGCTGLEQQRIVLLGSPRRPLALLPSPCCPPPPAHGCGELQVIWLCARLLQWGGRLVLLDRPRGRQLIDSLLPLAADAQGRWRGRCLLEPDLAAACREASALLLLPQWQQPRGLAWKALARRMRPGALLFDLRPSACLASPVAAGLRAWRLGGSSAWS